MASRGVLVNTPEPAHAASNADTRRLPGPDELDLSNAGLGRAPVGKLPRWRSRLSRRHRRDLLDRRFHSPARMRRDVVQSGRSPTPASSSRQLMDPVVLPGSAAPRAEALDLASL